ncbi:hypothetical protein EN866_34410 [Mesorhizobium sp. M2D.F.Ca.ET.223.01.1.1]|uniref:hypothetical protein n=1 Tax=Mesorhizobium sp. M2D.F.Ca.ET.223.01.1.1 TaxID=2563940 RepID=UPI0010932155|nr:hypothetical protein [Mesorhizobium sp. M2D.F.Ca.ET.223.01.1.1]TGR83025.1 hypothetical protein EN866_34410 [Mesorhizobium sp. M2D.F.Ca.ET.223.01.1.1]TGT64479.1 hypothetical protein EN802_32340 [bacterium M00.F.Ca.ET.159.01.1.1]TGT79324.1 hypothetical protein EN800_31680 [bacterium M00.F.Ca.ET.157.01.1.1]
MTASARGLFRATGKKSKPVPQRLLDGSYERVEHLEREKDDFYPTPAEPTIAFLSAEAARLKDFPHIWEPAAGDGAMVRHIQEFGHRAVWSDLIDRGCGAAIRSFYDFAEPLAPAIITNPPFAECNRDPGWIRHALERLDVEYMALLLPVNWTGASGRAALWAQFPPARMYIMRWRIDFTGQGAPPMLNAWFVWDKAWKGETVLRMLDRKDARQSELFGEAA